MGSLKRKSGGSDSMVDERLTRRRLRRLVAISSRKIDSRKNGIGGGSSAKNPRRTKGNLRTQGTTKDRVFPPDDDYRIFMDGLALGLPPAVDSDCGVGDNSACDSEAATHDVGSGLKEDWSKDIDIDLFKFLTEKCGGRSSSIRAENNGEGNNGDAGANSGCGMSMDAGSGAAQYADNSFLWAFCSSDRNGWSVKDKPGAETSGDYEGSEFVEEARDIEGSANNGDDERAVDRSFDNAAVAEEVTYHCKNEQLDPPDRHQTADNDIDEVSDRDQTADNDIDEGSDPDQNADNDIVEASDAVYDRFLQNLRADGNSYNVELPVGNGKSLNLVYEKQDVSSGQCDVGETRRTSLKRKNREPEIGLGQGCNETQGDCQRRDGDTGCDLRVPIGEKICSLVGRKFSYKTEKGVRSGFRREERSQMEDLLEREMNKKGKETRDSKVASGREGKSCFSMKTRIRDETGDAPETACRIEAPMPMRVQHKTGHTGTKKVPAPSLARKKRTETRPCQSEQIMKAQKDVSDLEDRERRRLISEETQRKESFNPIPREEPATTKTPSSNNHHCRPNIERVENDKCYETFLRALEMKPTHVEFVPLVGEKVVYHDYPSSLCDSDVMEIDAATFANDVNTPFVPAKNHEVIDVDLEPEEGRGGSYYNSAFRVKLLEILRKPYDQKEYDSLLKEVSRRKQLVKDRELRHGRTVTVKLEGVRRSYLDNHKDFARKFQELKHDSDCNRPVRLNLLRGFVYWLENIPLPGSFKPWLDESCLNVLPSCKRVPWH